MGKLLFIVMEHANLVDVPYQLIIFWTYVLSLKSLCVLWVARCGKILLTSCLIIYSFSPYWHTRVLGRARNGKREPVEKTNVVTLYVLPNLMFESRMWAYPINEIGITIEWMNVVVEEQEEGRKERKCQVVSFILFYTKKKKKKEKSKCE